MKPELYPAETQEPHTVCVTGVTGYVGSNLVARLLAAGHTVHGTVRDPAKAADLKALPGAEDRLLLFEADLLQPEGFKEAMQGCTVVFHTASPFSNNAGYGKTAQWKLVDPAVNGTAHVLGAVHATPSVRRVVLTSSTAAIAHSYLEKDKGYLHTEADWNDKSSLYDQPYHYSKTMAEKKAWEIAGQQTRWDLVVINPSLILGPPVTSRRYGESVKLLRRIFHGEYSLACPVTGVGMVDVRDVAAAHMLAAFKPFANGRYIVCAANRQMRDVVCIVADLYPKTVHKPLITAPKWLALAFSPLLGISRDVVRANVGGTIHVSGERATRELGLSYIPLEETIKDMCDECEKYGIIKPKASKGLMGGGPRAAAGVAIATACLLLAVLFALLTRAVRLPALA